MWRVLVVTQLIPVQQIWQASAPVERVRAGCLLERVRLFYLTQGHFLELRKRPWVTGGDPIQGPAPLFPQTHFKAASLPHDQLPWWSLVMRARVRARLNAKRLLRVRFEW